MSIKDEYLAKHNDDLYNAAAALARDLMRGDEATLKQGYTMGNALIAVARTFDLPVEGVAVVVEKIIPPRLPMEFVYIHVHEGTQISAYRFTNADDAAAFRAKYDGNDQDGERRDWDDVPELPAGYQDDPDSDTWVYVEAEKLLSVDSETVLFHDDALWEKERAFESAREALYEERRG